MHAFQSTDRHSAKHHCHPVQFEAISSATLSYDHSRSHACQQCVQTTMPIFFGEEWRIGDCKIGAGQGQARVRQQQQSEARTEQDRCYTAAQDLREVESL